MKRAKIYRESDSQLSNTPQKKWRKTMFSLPCSCGESTQWAARKAPSKQSPSKLKGLDPDNSWQKVREGWNGQLVELTAMENKNLERRKHVAPRTIHGLSNSSRHTRIKGRKWQKTVNFYLHEGADGGPALSPVEVVHVRKGCIGGLLQYKVIKSFRIQHKNRRRKQKIKEDQSMKKLMAVPAL